MYVCHTNQIGANIKNQSKLPGPKVHRLGEHLLPL